MTTKQTKQTKESTPARHVILIDIETFVPSSALSQHDVEMVSGLLREHIPGYDHDQQIVACSHHTARVAAFAFPRARQLWKSGRDGPASALLEVLETEGLSERYQRVTICSGNRILAGAVAALAADGIDVTVLSFADRLAARLQLAARHVCLLHAEGPMDSAAGAA